MTFESNFVIYLQIMKCLNFKHLELFYDSKMHIHPLSDVLDLVIFYSVHLEDKTAKVAREDLYSYRTSDVESFQPRGGSQAVHHYEQKVLACQNMW